jgi:hypothetical protein
MYTWTDSVKSEGLPRYFVVRLVGKQVASLDSYFDGAQSQRSHIVRQMAGYLIIPIVLLFTVLGRRLQVDLRSRWRIVISVVGAVMAASVFWMAMNRANAPLVVTTAAVVNAVIGCTLLNFISLIALEREVEKTGSFRLLTTVRAFGRGFAAEPTGLAVIRGTLIGLIVLGLDAVLVWLSIHHLGMFMDAATLGFVEAYHNYAWPAVHHMILVIGLTPMLAAFIAWLAALPAYSIRRSWLRVLIAGLLVAIVLPGYPFVGTASLLQPYPLKALIVLFESIVFIWSFLRFDFLTLMISTVTFAFCSGNYFFLQVLQPTGSVQEKLVFAVWIAFVMAGIAVAYQRRILPFLPRSRD